MAQDAIKRKARVMTALRTLSLSILFATSSVSCGAESLAPEVAEDVSSPPDSLSAAQTSASEHELSSLEACQNLSNRAQSQLAAAVEEVAQCEDDSDCQPSPMPPHCWDACTEDLLGSDDYKAEVARQLDIGLAGNTCGEFEQGDCDVVPHSCPVHSEPITGYSCVGSRCVTLY